MDGLGELTIDNGTNLDADVKLVGGNRVLSRTYVSAYQQATVHRIPPGAYRLMFCQASGGAMYNGTFLPNRTCFELDKWIEFTERDNGGGYIEYGKHTVTLHEVVGGNIRKTRLDAAAFDSFK